MSDEKKEAQEQNPLKNTDNSQNGRSINKHHEKYENFKWENKELLENGPVSDSHRSCRDIICCFIFLGFIAGCVVVTILGFSQGNPNLVLYPYDEDGRQCGRDNGTLYNFTDYPYLYFYAAVSNLKDYNVTGIAQGVCVRNCPKNNTGNLDCQKTVDNQNCLISSVDFYVSVPFLGRFCVPDPAYIVNTTISTLPSIVINGTTYQQIAPISNQASASSFISLNVISSDKLISWMTDLITCWPIILASVGYSLVIAIVYMVLVRCCAGVIAYTSIILILGSLSGLGYVFQARMDYYQSISDDNYYLTMKVLCILFYVLAGIWLLIILFMCNRIRLSIALVEVTAKYLSSTWSVFFVPFIFYIISALYYAYWVALSIFLYSAGTVQKSNSFIPNVTWTSTIRYAWWYNLFALFYVNAFINAFNQFVLASTACIWYFEHRIEGGASKPVRRSFYRGIRYHLGSIAFGSLIVAIIRFIMAIVEYFKQKIDSTKVGKTMGRFYKCMMTCVQCCLECVARLVEFINKHAYIQIALKGDSFCVSAFEGFGLVFRNLGRWSMLFLIGGMFNIIGILFISSCTGLIGYLIITRVAQFSDKLNSPVLPVVVMGIIGFIIGAISMGIYGMSGDAMMHCYLLDEELNDKLPKHTPTELQDFIKQERD